jgi:hypothetical protein
MLKFFIIIVQLISLSEMKQNLIIFFCIFFFMNKMYMNIVNKRKINFWNTITDIFDVDTLNYDR